MVNLYLLDSIRLIPAHAFSLAPQDWNHRIVRFHMCSSDNDHLQNALLIEWTCDLSYDYSLHSRLIMNINYLDWFANIKCRFHFAWIKFESKYFKNDTRTESGRAEVETCTTCCQIQLKKGRGHAVANTATEGRFHCRRFQFAVLDF